MIPVKKILALFLLFAQPSFSAPLAPAPPSSADPQALALELQQKNQELTGHIMILRQFRQNHFFYGNPCDEPCAQAHNVRRSQTLRTLQAGSALISQLKATQTTQLVVDQQGLTLDLLYKNWVDLSQQANILLLATKRP